jgi:hypothetical protein
MVVIVVVVTVELMAPNDRTPRSREGFQFRNSR